MAGLKNVLVVEDDAMIRDLYKMALANNRYAVEVADSADEMYPILEHFHPDVVLLDVMLPNTTGIEILQELRTNPAYGCMTVKILVLTNLAQQSIADTAIASGADGYIIKADILPKDLIQVIKSFDEDEREGEP